MSITHETAKEHAKDPAVSCCRFEAGTVIGPSNLEDPQIFSDLTDSGLLTIPANCLTIDQVLGATLIKTVDALTPLTAEVIAGTVSKKDQISAAPTAMTQMPATATATAAKEGFLRIHIGEGKDILLEIPMGITAPPVTVPLVTPVTPATPASTISTDGAVAPVYAEEKVVRKLIKKHYKINKVLTC